ncbi:MAG: autotransporter outer membrane beta-barrel domain-containing protein [Thermoguttaceae bacterium]
MPSARAEVLINGILQSDYYYSLRNDATYNVVSTGLGDNITVDYNSSSPNKPWRGMLSLAGTAVPDRTVAIPEYTTRINLTTDFYLGGLIKTNTKAVLEIQTNNTTPPLNQPRWFNITKSGRMYLAGGAVVNGINESSLTVVNSNWRTYAGSSLMFGFNNDPGAAFNDKTVVATNDWSDSTKFNVAQIEINGQAQFNGNIGVISSQPTLWQTPNGTRYKAGSIVVNGTMTTQGIGVAMSSLFYRPEISVYNSDNLSGGTTPNTIRIYGVVSGFGGLNQNLQSLADYGYDVTYLSENQMEVARNLDRARASVPAGSTIASVIKPMWEYGDSNGESGRELGHAEQKERITRLGHLFQQLSGDTHANAMYLGLYRPWAVPLANLNLGAQMIFTGDPEKPVGNLNRLWITPMYTNTFLKSDGNAREAGVSRVGFQMGADRRIAQNASAGLALGYHRAYLNQENDRVQFGDLQIGAYGGAMVGNYFEVRSYLGFGLQNYDSTRIVDIADLGTGDRSQTAFGKADGCGVYFTTEFARPLFFGPIIVRPTMAIDSETAIRKEFTETGDDISLRVDRSTYSRTRLRFGSTFETNPLPTSRLMLNSRVFYAVQLDGKDAATVNSQFNSVFADPGQTARSIKHGVHYIDVGGGMKAYLNRARTLSGLLQYDGSFSEYTFTNGVALGMMFVF